MEQPKRITSDFQVIIPLVIIMYRKKDGGISVVTKKRPAIGTFFDNHCK
jgi:hypothetical protein